MNGNGILAAVKENAHYEITLQPRSAGDLPPHSLEAIVDECRVHRREYPYPYPPSGRNCSVRRLEGCIEASHDAGMCIGVWRFCRSGQFKQYLGLPEARWPRDEPRSEKFDTPLREKFLEPVVTLYQVSEVFLFARRLAGRVPGVWTISVNLSDMQDRMLDIRVPERFGLYNDYRCSAPAISLSAEVHSADLQACYADLAVEKALEITARFGWGGRDMERTLRQEQDRLYRRLGTRAMPSVAAPPAPLSAAAASIPA